MDRLIQFAPNGAYLDVDSFLQSEVTLEEEFRAALIKLMSHSFELYQNGLGYNNILFMSTVLGDMSLEKAGVYLNILTVEEPEAHLHPQLQELIHSYFENCHNTSPSIQVIYSSHSPSLVSRIGIDSINLLFEKNHIMRCYPLSKANLLDKDRDYLEKYLDVTKSQMFFAKSILFVEGISESILVPEFAALLGRKLDKYAVELVNVGGVAFQPFVKVLTFPDESMSFAKAVIITDDDRCTDKTLETYISKEIDFNDSIDGLSERINKGTPSKRFQSITELCGHSGIQIYGAVKTLEYELALQENNITYLEDAISDVFPDVGPTLKERVDNETDLQRKATIIWLFVRMRDSSKAEIAQSLGRVIRKQIQDIAAGAEIDKPFVVPLYIQNAIYAATEPRGQQE